MTAFDKVDEQLFRREWARIVAALTRLFGLHNLALAEDVAQDAFCRALEVWKARGVPENPGAWLMTTARNRAIDVIRSERTARTFAPELGRLLESEWTTAPLLDEAFSAPGIQDGELRMMFACAHPRLSEEVQIALMLNILCGFSARQIASAFLTGLAATEKRIARGRKTLAASPRLLDRADSEFVSRLPAVRRALYLLFSEGYHGASAESPIRAELCREAMRLVMLLAQEPRSATPETFALAAMMHFHAARLPARLDDAGELAPLRDQDRSRWDRRMLDEGLALFARSAAGDELSTYHLEAAIAALHASASAVGETNWSQIVALYDQLMAIAPSPVVELNRAVAVAERDGAESGLAALAAIADADRLRAYPFLSAAMGELELRRGNRVAAHEQFAKALLLARNDAERKMLEKRIAACGAGAGEV